MTKASLAKNKKQHKMGVKDGLVLKKKNQALKSAPTGQVVIDKANKKQQNGKNANGAQKGKNKKQFAKKQKPEVKTADLEGEDLDSENESMDDSDESMDETLQKKGVTMFKGLQKDDDSDDNDDDDEEDEYLNSSDDSDLKLRRASSDEYDSLSEEDDDDDDEKDENDELNDSKPGLKALLGDSLADDDDDDDFEEDNESDDDADMSDDEAALESSNVAEDDDDDEEDDDDDDDDDDEDEDDEDNEDDEEKSGLGLKALLGDSLVDEDDDDDFEGEDEDDEDDDISEESDDDENDESIEESKSKGKKSKEKKEKVILSREEQAEKESRTVYVGNIPKETTKSAITKLFRPFGEIDSIRFRGVVPEDSRMSQKVATITKKMHPKVLTVHAYVVFKNKDSTKQALTLNGYELGESHLRVDLTKSPQKDQKKAVFLGNLSFDVTEEEIRSHFVSCGKIDSIRIVKDRRSGLGKGFGYLNFEEEDSVALALKLTDTKLKGREVRVKLYNRLKSRKRNPARRRGGQKNPEKKFKNVEGKPVAVQSEKGENKQKQSQGKAKREKPTNSESPNPSPVKKEKKSSFQGRKADAKKKPKVNKLDKQKKILAKKLTSTKKTSKTTD